MLVKMLSSWTRDVFDMLCQHYQPSKASKTFLAAGRPRQFLDGRGAPDILGGKTSPQGAPDIVD